MRSRITCIDLVSFRSDIGVSGFMTADQIGLTDLGIDEVAEHAADAHVLQRVVRQVVIVQEDHQQPDVVACGLGRGVLVGSNLERRVVARRGFAGELDELERLNRLRDAVFADVEVLGREIGERHPVSAGDRHVDANEVDASPGTWALERGPAALPVCAGASPPADAISRAATMTPTRTDAPRTLCSLELYATRPGVVRT